MKRSAKTSIMYFGTALILLIGVMIFIAVQNTTASQPVLNSIDATKIADSNNREATSMSQIPPTKPAYPVNPTSTGATQTPYYDAATVVGNGVIITDPQPFFGGSTYRFTTMWRVSLQEKTFVYAGVVGGSGTNASQGVIIVVSQDATGQRLEDKYTLPQTAGAATITGVVGQKASITTLNGTRYEFDLATRSLNLIP